MLDNLMAENSMLFSTPYFLFDKEKLKQNISFHKEMSERLQIKLIYSLKSLSQVEILKEIAQSIEGFSVSSLFESNLARYVNNGRQHTIHFVSPGIINNQWDMLSKAVHFVTFNSIEQLTRFSNQLHPQISYGIRINPEISFIKESRYNPCKKFSKLGVCISDILKLLRSSKYTGIIQGIHFHNNCESRKLEQLTKTFMKVESRLKGYFNQFKWINLGGGYLFKRSENIHIFYDLIKYIKKKYNFESIIIEPGSSIVQDTAYLVSSVVDIFKRNGKNIAVLDTTTNHLPEVLEYQYKPDILESNSSGSHEYELAGCSCLAGDIFGTYHFKNELQLGKKITFDKVGSYSLVKMNMFNGINLPDIYYTNDNDQFKKIKSYTFNDYMNNCKGVENHAIL